MTYRIADGHDNEAGFTDVTPQPRSEGILATETRHSLNGTRHQQGLYVIWEYTALNDTQYSSLLAQFGISEATPTNEVTIRTRDNAHSLTNKNGTILLPERGVDARREMGFWRDVRFTIRDLSDT